MASMDTRGERVQVCLRLCPGVVPPLCLTVGDGGSVTFLRGAAGAPATRYSVDHVFTESSTQECVFSAVGAPAVRDVLEGFNASVICYGQTGTGKTYTMTGPDGSDSQGGGGSLRLSPSSGVLPRAVHGVFSALPAAAATLVDPVGAAWEAHVAYVEIYREEVYDLLAEWAGVAPRALSLREDPTSGVFLDGLSWHGVSSAPEALALVVAGTAARATAATFLNAHSSRSHAIFYLRIMRRTGAASAQSPQVQVGTLALVDLAGSERISKSGAVGTRLDEAASINLSLSALGNCVAALGARTSAAAAAAGAAPGLASSAAAGAAASAAAASISARSTHIPFRDSKLTRLLSRFLGGGARTTLVVTAKADAASASETGCTLEFGARASRVRVAAAPNIAKDYKTLYASLQRQLELLRGAQAAPSSSPSLDLPDSRHHREDAEAEDTAALRADLSRAHSRVSELESELAVGRSTHAALIEREKSALKALRDLEASASAAAGAAIGGASDAVPPTVRDLFASIVSRGSSAEGELAISWAREVAAVRLGVARTSAAAVSAATQTASVERARADSALAALAAARLDALDASTAARSAIAAAAAAAQEADSRRAALLEELASTRSDADAALERARAAEESVEQLRCRLRDALCRQGPGFAMPAQAAEVISLYEETVNNLSRRVACLESIAEAQDNALADALATRRAGRVPLPKSKDVAQALPVPAVAVAAVAPPSSKLSAAQAPSKPAASSAHVSSSAEASIKSSRARPQNQSSHATLLLATPVPVTLGASAAALAATNAARFGLGPAPKRF